MVTFRKKKCFRHIFLFQELVLFSKTRKTDVGNDTYIYKQSFKVHTPTPTPTPLGLPGNTVCILVVTSLNCATVLQCTDSWVSQRSMAKIEAAFDC